MSEREPTALQVRVAALPAQLRALVDGMDSVHWGPRRIVEAAADEIELGPTNHCGACERTWRGPKARFCDTCQSGAADLVRRIKDRARSPYDIHRAAWDLFDEIVDTAEPIGGEAPLRLCSLGYACPLCGAVTRAGPGFTKFGLRGHLSGRQSPCPVTAMIHRQLYDWSEQKQEEQARAAERRAAGRATQPEYCYLVQCGTTGNVKIGKANDVAKRLSDLQRGTGAKLTLLASLETDDGLTLEAQLHARFAAHRLHGEWFSPNPDIMEAFGLRGER